MNAADQNVTSDRTPGTPAPVTARPFRVLLVAWISAVVIVALFAVLAVLLPQSPTGVNFRTIDQVGLAIIGLFIAGGVLLMARPRVKADAEGIEVRNIIMTRRFPWSDVERVAFYDGAAWARLDLPDDEYFSVMAIQAADGTRAVDAIRKVRALHAASRR